MNYKNFQCGKFRAMVDMETGNIIAYDNLHRKEIKTNVNSFINAFPYEDKDFIVLVARQELEKCGIDRTHLKSFKGTI